MIQLFTDLDPSSEEFYRAPSALMIGSVMAGIAIASLGAAALVIAVLGGRLRRRESKSGPPAAPKESPIAQVEPVAPVAPIPPPPPSKTSGLHFVPAIVGASGPPASRRLGGNYVRRSPPKRSTATRQKPEDSAT